MLCNNEKAIFLQKSDQLPLETMLHLQNARQDSFHKKLFSKRSICVSIVFSRKEARQKPPKRLLSMQNILAVLSTVPTQAPSVLWYPGLPQQEALTEVPEDCKCQSRDAPELPLISAEAILQRCFFMEKTHYEQVQPNQVAARRWTSNHEQPGVQISQCMCQTTLQASEMHPGGNSFHMGISQERTLLLSLIQFIPVSLKSTFARHFIGDD